MYKALIDTNVIVDALAAREPFRECAELILLLAAEDQIDGCVTGSIITDVYYLIRKNISHNKVLDAIKTLIQVLNIVSVGDEECIEAIQANMDDFEDAVIVVCASRILADFIVSRDKEFARAGCAVPVITPADFIRKLQKEGIIRQGR